MPKLPQPAVDAPQEDWLVYADALQQAGDPRGELIVLEAEDRDAHIKANAKELLGARAAKYVEAYRFEWVGCLAVHATARVEDNRRGPAIVGALLASPVVAALKTLRIAGVAHDEKKQIRVAKTIERALENLPATCEALELVDRRAEVSTTIASRDFYPGENLVDMGPLQPVFDCEQLTSVYLQVADAEQLNLRELNAPHLESFTLHCLKWAEAYSVPSEVAAGLIAASWPKLRELELRIPETFTYNFVNASGAYRSVYGNSSNEMEAQMYEEYDYYGDEGDPGYHEPINFNAELGPLLDNLKSVPLERLALTSFASARQMCEALRDHGLPDTLKELDLSDSAMGSELTGFLVEHADVFSGLNKLALHGTAFTDADVAKLEKAGLPIEHRPGTGPKYRYQVGME